MAISVMIWIMCGVVWSTGCAIFMGPIFAALGNIIRQLNIVPALGSSVWVCVSTFVMVAVINIPFPAAPVFNLPLISLIIANWGVVKSAFTTLANIDGISDLIPSVLLRSARSAKQCGLADCVAGLCCSDCLELKDPGYYWHDGQCHFGTFCHSSRPKSWFVVKPLSLPEGASQALQTLRENGYSYMSGQQLNCFSQNFQIWRHHTQKIAFALILRLAFLFHRLPLGSWCCCLYSSDSRKCVRCRLKLLRYWKRCRTSN